MKNFSIFVLAIMLSTSLFAQHLPSEIHVSADGHRLITGGQAASGLFDPSQIRHINFEFPQSNYWSLMTSNYASKTDISAIMTLDGEVLDTIGIRFKGQTSYSQNNSQKKSFSIDTEWTVPGLEAMGYEAMNLNCGFLDHSSMREMLFFDLGRKYIPMANAAFTTISLNGQDWGLYTNVQQLDGDFIRSWFPSNDGTRWRCERTTSGGGPGGGGPGGGGGSMFGAGSSSLNYLGADTSLYTPNYTLKKTSKPNPWDDLVRTCDVLNNVPLANLEDSLKHVLDVDRALWQVAVEILFTDDDSYVFKGGMDYFAYWEPETGRITPLEYDGNTCMDLGLANSWSVFYRENDVKFPLMNRLLKVPALRQRYLAHVRTIVEESFAPSVVEAKIAAYQAMIDGIVKDDPKKIYSYAQFTNGVDELREFFADRRAFILQNTEVNVAVPTISDVVFSADNVAFTAPKNGKICHVTANASAAAGLNGVFLHYSTGVTGAFQKTPMYDDGQHNDGQANDGKYGADLPAFSTATLVRFYLEAVSANAANTVTFEPRGAEHDDYFYTVQADAAFSTDVVINELMASNATIAADQDGEFDDWIELYNKGTQVVDLSGYHLSDNSFNRPKFTIPAGTTIAPNSYLIFWADEDGTQTGLHANFKLASGGESLWLWSPDTLNQIDFVEFGQQVTDKGYARTPNGTGGFTIKTATFGFNNDLASGLFAPNLAETLDMYPNPSTGNVWIKNTDLNFVEVFNLQGKRVLQTTFNSNQSLSLDHLAKGLYFLKVGDKMGKIVLE